MSKVRDENFINIQGWMIKRLGLKGNDLLIYAIIYGFSQDNENEFTGSRQYLADWTNSTIPGIAKNLKSLTEKGLIYKKEFTMNGVKYCAYRANLEAVGDGKQSCPDNSVTRITQLSGGDNKVTQGSKQSYPGGEKQSFPNNLLDTQENISKEKKTHKKASLKLTFGEYKNVKLTQEEHDRLCQEYGEEKTKRAIAFFDCYIEEKGYKSKSHNLAMRRWVFQAAEEAEAKNRTTPQGRTDGRVGYIPDRQRDFAHEAANRPF